ncbi:DUF2946 domain-containing protein [Klebsiella sp. WOUb02]|uniref:DUF2946 domain-containing protein n=1 Tax=Klebsiella sp. WOUb02 TaxID=3161071 RepID=UPI003CF3B646
MSKQPVIGNIVSRRISSNYIAAWLALFSIAMLFVAPVISKSISHRASCEHHNVAAMNMSDMHHGMMMAEPCRTMSDMDQRMMSGQAMSPVEEIACGYCQTPDPSAVYSGRGDGSSVAVVAVSPAVARTARRFPSCSSHLASSTRSRSSCRFFCCNLTIYKKFA